MKSIAIFGSSGHARVIVDLAEKVGCYRIAGFIDSFRPKGQDECGYPVLGCEADLPSIQSQYGVEGLLIAIGDNWMRSRAWERVRAITENLPLLTAVHPSAQVGRDVHIGPGSVLLAGSIVNSGARIGTGCILNTNSSLDHDCEMGDFSSLGPGVTIGGNVQIGRYSAIGLSASIIHGITIGEHTVIGAGALVVRDMPEFVVAYGTPARAIRARHAGETYL